MASSLDTTMKYAIPRLNSVNYFNWRFRVEMLLKERELWQTIKLPIPSEADAEWCKADEKALAIISLMIEDDQIQHVRNCVHARDAWQALKDFHERDTPGSKVRVLRTIMKQRADESSDVEAHVNYMNELFQKLLALGDELKPEFFHVCNITWFFPKQLRFINHSTGSKIGNGINLILCSIEDNRGVSSTQRT